MKDWKCPKCGVTMVGDEEVCHSCGYCYVGDYDCPSCERLRKLCGEVWVHMHPNSKDCEVCRGFEQRLRDEGVLK